MAAAVLTKMLRGGRRLAGASAHPPLPPARQGSAIARREPEESGVGSHLLPWTGRRASLVGGVGPLPPRFGGTAPASPSAHPLLLLPRPGSGSARRAPQEGAVGSRLLLPRIGRRTSLVGGVGPLPLRFGGTAMTSPSARTRFPFLLQKVRLMCSKKMIDGTPSLSELNKYYVWIGKFEWYESKFIPMYLWKIIEDQVFKIKFIRRYWIVPALLVGGASFMIVKFLIEYHRYTKINKEMIQVDNDILQVQTETEELMKKHLELKIMISD